MKKLLTPLLFLLALFSPMLNAAPVTIKIAYESNPGEPADTVEALGRTCEEKAMEILFSNFTQVHS